VILKRLADAVRDMPPLKSFNCRMGFVYSSLDELQRKIRLALQLLKKEEKAG